MANSADPYQLASSEANWSGSTLFERQDIQYSSGGFSKSPRAGGEWIRVERIKF